MNKKTGRGEVIINGRNPSPIESFIMRIYAPLWIILGLISIIIFFILPVIGRLMVIAAVGGFLVFPLCGFLDAVTYGRNSEYWRYRA